MEFFRKKLIRKFTFFLLICLAMVGGIGFFLWKSKESLPPSWLLYGFLGLLGFFSLVSFSLYYSSVHRPFKKILKEVKAMLTGKRYNKIYTDRIDEWAVMAHFFNDVSKNLERIAATVEEGKRMSSELELASDIQKRILPKAMPQVPGLDVFANTRAAVEVGGDSYDVIHSNNNTFIYVGDVTGHGVPAGLVMMMVNTLIHTFAEFYPSGYDLIVQTNKQLKPRIQPSMFMTMALLRWQETDSKLFLTGAGHEHVVHFHKAKNDCEIRKTGGIALGMVSDNSGIIKEEILPFEIGDTIILYSDGLVEARNMQGEMFGLPRLKQTVEKYMPTTKTSQELFTALSADFAEFVENQTQQDDITLIVVKRRA